jgi:hypothetical protein
MVKGKTRHFIHSCGYCKLIYFEFFLKSCSCTQTLITFLGAFPELLLVLSSNCNQNRQYLIVHFFISNHYEKTGSCNIWNIWGNSLWCRSVWIHKIKEASAVVSAFIFVSFSFSSSPYGQFCFSSDTCYTRSGVYCHSDFRLLL